MQVENKPYLEGKWFHKMIDGKIGWQGEVVKRLSTDRYALQLHSWVMGEPTYQVVDTINLKYRFYDTAGEMDEAYQRSKGD